MRAYQLQIWLNMSLQRPCTYMALASSFLLDTSMPSTHGLASLPRVRVDAEAGSAGWARPFPSTPGADLAMLPLPAVLQGIHPGVRCQCLQGWPSHLQPRSSCFFHMRQLQRPMLSTYTTAWYRGCSSIDWRMCRHLQLLFDGDDSIQCCSWRSMTA